MSALTRHHFILALSARNRAARDLEGLRRAPRVDQRCARSTTRPGQGGTPSRFGADPHGGRSA